MNRALDILSVCEEQLRAEDETLLYNRTNWVTLMDKMDADESVFPYILPKIEKGEWKRVLFVPTGALLSKVSYNEGKSVPGIAQAVVIEHC